MSLREPLLRIAAFLVAQFSQHGGTKAPRKDSLVASSLGVGDLRLTATTMIDASESHNEETPQE